MTRFESYQHDFKRLTSEAARAAGLSDPIAFHPYHYAYWLIRHAKRGPLLAVDGVLQKQWSTGLTSLGAHIGMRTYSLEGIGFVRCESTFDKTIHETAFDFYVCERSDYAKLYRQIRKLMRTRVPDDPPPVMLAEQFSNLKQNSIGYLDRNNLKWIRDFGGRPKRGILLTGSPGNGKTSVCRWLRNECHRVGLESQEVGPDAYQAARRACNPVSAVKDLFTVSHRGIIFFDDMDIALRDRTISRDTDDQAVFLSALDGIDVVEGVVYIFTTNCSLDQIDPAFKRPGRIDLVLHFEKPTEELRRELVSRWHESIRTSISPDQIVSDTAGFSFAELEELKNLLVLRYLNAKMWDLEWALDQFATNRSVLMNPRSADPTAPGAVS